MPNNFFKKLLTWNKDILKQEVLYSLEIAVHPSTTGKIIINYPGAEGHIDGYNDKYITLSKHIVDQNLASVVRSGNDYALGWDMNLRQVIQYALENSLDICGSETPELFLMGFSAGAGAISMIAWEYPEVKAISLCAPAIGVGENKVKNGLASFEGDVYIVIGEDDEIVGHTAGDLFLDFCTNAKHKELVKIPNCTHQFMGKTNGRIMSQIPFWAFDKSNKKNFPDFEAGIELY